MRDLSAGAIASVAVDNIVVAAIADGAAAAIGPAEQD